MKTARIITSSTTTTALITIHSLASISNIYNVHEQKHFEKLFHRVNTTVTLERYMRRAFGRQFRGPTGCTSLSKKLYLKF